MPFPRYSFACSTRQGEPARAFTACQHVAAAPPLTSVTFRSFYISRSRYTPQRTARIPQTCSASSIVAAATAADCISCNTTSQQSHFPQCSCISRTGHTTCNVTSRSLNPSEVVNLATPLLGATAAKRWPRHSGPSSRFDRTSR